MRFSIREATNDDAEFVMDLFATRHVRQFAHGPDSVDVFLERLRRARQGNDYAVLIVECDGQPFGNVNFTIVKWMAHGDTRHRIQGTKDWRRTLYHDVAAATGLQ